MASEFADFMAEHPTVFHFTKGVQQMLNEIGYVEIFERDFPELERGGKYFVKRNDTNIIAFEIGENFICGIDGLAIMCGHIDANRLSVKPKSIVQSIESYDRIGIAPYGGPLLGSWFDRDLGIGGRALVQTKHGVVTKLVKLPGTIGTIPSLAPHFGNRNAPNVETNFVPIIGTCGDYNGKSLTHSESLLQAVSEEIGCRIEDIVELELELYSSELPTIGGLKKDLFMCSRLDDRLCSWVAIKGLIESCGNSDHAIKMVALYDNEEVGSLTRQGGYNSLLGNIIGLVHQSLGATKDELFQTIANSVALSADVTHAVNPNYIEMYAEGHMPRLNKGMAVKRLGKFTSNAIESAICFFISGKAGIPLQTFAPRNDTASGSTIGPMIAASLGIRTIDIGIPVLAMHSIREITGVKDIDLGIGWFKTFFEMANQLITLTI